MLTETIVCDMSPQRIAAAPTRVLIAPWGLVERSDGGSFTVDDESARLIVSKFNRLGHDVPIDYGHQTLGGEHAPPSGKAPAAGWITALSVEPGVGIVADVNWTATAADHIAGREFRYLSPVFNTRWAGGPRAARRIIDELHSVGLTNTPAILGSKPIVNSAGGITTREELAAAMEQDKTAEARRRVVKDAGRTWDNQPDIRKFTDRPSYIHMELVDVGHQGLTPDERKQLAGGGAALSEPPATLSNKSGETDPRRLMISKLAREYEGSPELQRMCSSKRSYVNGGMLAERLDRLSDEEAAWL